MSMENRSKLSILKQRSGQTSCPRCGKSSMVLDMSTGEQVCTNCGYVIKDSLEEVGPEWRNFSKEQGGNDRSRVGSPTSLAMHDMGLSTVIGLESSDASGNALKSSMKQRFERLRTWDRRSKIHSSADRNLRQAFGELARLAEKINVGDAVIEKAAYIYRKVLEKKLDQGKVDNCDDHGLIVCGAERHRNTKNVEGLGICQRCKKERSRAKLSVDTQGDGS